MRTSDTVAKIAAALSAFQADVKDPRRDGQNPHFRSKYVQIDGLLDAVRPTLSKHGLSVIQSTGGDGQTITVTTMILHTSGELIETDALSLKAQRADPQGAGSAITYGRRYSLSAALGVAWDDDDDGNAASEPQKPGQTPVPTEDAKTVQTPVPTEDAKFATLKLIMAEGAKKGVNPHDFADIIRMKYKKIRSSELTKAEVNDLAKNYMKYMSDLVGGLCYEQGDTQRAAGTRPRIEDVGTRQ